MNEAIRESRRRLATLFSEIELRACLEHDVIQSELRGKCKIRTANAVKARNWIGDQLRKSG